MSHWIYIQSQPRPSHKVAMWFMTFLCSHLKMAEMPRERYRKCEEALRNPGGNPVQNVLEMAVLGENASQETHSLTYFNSQSDKVR